MPGPKEYRKCQICENNHNVNLISFRLIDDISICQYCFYDIEALGISIPEIDDPYMSTRADKISYIKQLKEKRALPEPKKMDIKELKEKEAFRKHKPINENDIKFMLWELDNLGKKKDTEGEDS